MSGEGPESIPTSADPRSRRPTKKRALSPASAQAASVDALFAHPERPVRVPPAGGKAVRAAAPVETIAHVQGSSAGAGSGEFHVYKASRRREYERLRVMEDELRREKGQQEFERRTTELARKDEERTRKNREKREKAKARKANKGKGGARGHAQGSPADAIEDASSTAQDKGGHRASNKRDRESTEDAPASTTQPAGLVIHDDD